MFRIFLAFLSHLSHCDESTDLWTGWCFKRCFRRCFAKKILRSSRSNNFDQTLDPNIHINESAAWIWDAKKCLPKRMVRLESTKVFGSQPAAETMARHRHRSSLFSNFSLAACYADLRCWSTKESWTPFVHLYAFVLLSITQFAVGFYSVANTLPEYFIQNHGMQVQFHDISESESSKLPTAPPSLSWHDLV